MWVLRLVGIILFFLLGCMAVWLLWPVLKQPGRDRFERWWSGCVLKILQLRVHVRGQWPTEPCMLAINHVSWVDVVIVNAVCPSAFIAKSEIARWPLAGNLARRAGTIFIERGRRHAVREVVDQARAQLLAGRNVGVFPEGTTSDGRSVRAFHSNLFQAALDTQKRVVPVCLRYFEPQGRFSTKPAFIEPQTLFQNLKILVSTPGGFDVMLVALAAVDCDQNRHLMADQVHMAIAWKLQHDMGSRDVSQST